MTRHLLRLALCIATLSASAATITVDSLSDASGCSLRNAIIASNTGTATVGCTAGSPGGAINITVSGTYSPTSALPAVTQFTDITATLGNFVLDGTSAGAASTGLTMNAGGTIRGLVIQNFGGSGIEVLSSTVNLYGNRIGTDAGGFNAAPNCTGVGNAGAGVRIAASTSNVNTINIGGAPAADHNVISGNQCHGISIVQSGAAFLGGLNVSGNYIGGNWCGCDAIPNSGYGIVTNASNTQHLSVFIGSQFGLGNSCTGACNVIASNVLGQIHVIDGVVSSVANVIGANANMTAGLPTDASPTGDGILVSGGEVTVNGNVIVRATGAGVRVDGGGLGVLNSRIGATAQGSIIPNGYGIRVHDAGFIQDLHSVVIQQNTIVGNTNAGIWLDGGHGVQVRQNNVGFLPGASPVPAANLGGGIVISNSGTSNATGNIVGGAGLGNTIAFNTTPGHGPGISILSGTGNQFLENSIYANTGGLSSLAIDLGGDGNTTNDPCDGDSGPNNYQNAPVITDATRIVTNSGCTGCFGSRISGTLNAQANTSYHIEVFTNPSGSSTPTQAQTYVGSVDVVTDAGCNAAWSFETQNAALANVVATATNGVDGTSEVSAPHGVWAGQPAEPKYDSNADDFTDILLRNFSTGGNASWLIDSSQQLIGIQNLAALPNTDYHIESSFYLAADGQNRNLLWRNYVTGANAIWTMPPAGSSPNAVINLQQLPNPQYYVGGTADFNGDGFTDILWRNNTTGAVAIWIMNGTSYQSTVNLPSVPVAQLQIVGTGDFNADGRADIVWHNTSTGANAIWFMDGTSYVSTLNIQAIPNTAYTIAAIGDYNHDRRPDLLWRNTTTGANAIWIMNGTTLATVANLPTLPNTNIVPSGPK
jgi:hypothetical protein